MNLEMLRKQIDDMDEQLVPLLNKRIKAALEIGHLKKQRGDQIWVPEREQAVLDHVTRINEGPLSSELLQHIYTAIMDAAKKTEEQI
jgi:chorismate mutase / prephenate dehydratase